MRNLFTKFVGVCSLLFIFSACEKDEDKTTLKVTAPPALTASATTASFVRANAANNAVTYSWPEVSFGYPAGITYTLQFAKQGTNFASPFEVVLGTEKTKTFTVGELNDVFAGADCTSANRPTTLDVRVKAAVGPSAAGTVYSNVSTIQGTPYPANMPTNTWGIIGSATPGGWNSDTDMPYDFCTRTFHAPRIALVAGEYKFRANDDWALNYGDNGADGVLESGGANIVLTTAGNYDVQLDLNDAAKPKYIVTRLP
jgi:hypothetical protein